MVEPQFILLYNPISNEGHLDSWHVLFIDLLRRHGYPVIAMTSDVQGLTAKLTARGISIGNELILESINKTSAQNLVMAKSLTKLSSLKKFWNFWNDYYENFIYQSHWARRGSTDGVLTKVRGVIQRHALIGLKTIIDLCYATYRKFQKISKYEENVFSESRLNPYIFESDINRIVGFYSGQISVVFNLYLDAYQQDFASWTNFKFDEDVPWVGLCITPRPEGDQGYYASKSYQGTCFLDESFVAEHSKRDSSKHYEWLPDITDKFLSHLSCKLAEDVLKFAAGRKIVFMGGSIGKQKNLVRWYELIKLCDVKDWFFVQMGRLNKNNMTQQDLAALKRVCRNPPSNLFIYPDYVTDETVFNAVINVSDIIFAVYRDFSRSSNMLSKSANFEKPVLVANDGLMGRRVIHYQIGLAVESDNVHAMKEGLEMIHHIPNLRLNFERFRQDFNDTVMQARLVAFLQKCGAS